MLIEPRSVVELAWWVLVLLEDSCRKRVQKYEARVMVIIKIRTPNDTPIAYAYPPKFEGSE